MCVKKLYVKKIQRKKMSKTMSSPLMKTILLMMVLGLITTASAAVTEPGSFSNYLDVFFQMVKGTAGKLAMALIMMFAGYKAYQNATPTPLLWGALAVVLIAAAPYLATHLANNVETFTDL